MPVISKENMKCHLSQTKGHTSDTQYSQVHHDHSALNPIIWDQSMDRTELD